MGGIFRYDGPIFGPLSKAADIVILNFLMLLGCLPVVTIGASVTAAHFAALRIVRGEGHVIRDFWDSFRQNFKQATAVWLILAVALSLFVVGILFFGRSNSVITVICLIGLILAFAVTLWVFPVLSKFVNSVGNTIRNGALLAVQQLLRTLVMAACRLLPVIAVAISWYTIPVVLLCGLSLPVVISAALYDKVFANLEEDVLAQTGK